MTLGRCLSLLENPSACGRLAFQGAGPQAAWVLGGGRARAGSPPSVLASFSLLRPSSQLGVWGIRAGEAAHSPAIFTRSNLEPDPGHTIRRVEHLFVPTASHTHGKPGTHCGVERARAGTDVGKPRAARAGRPPPPRAAERARRRAKPGSPQVGWGTCFTKGGLELTPCGA